MAEILLMPKMNLVMEEGLLGKWYKSVGDTVAEEEIICSIENEKEIADIPATTSGVVLKLWGVEGESYPIKTPIALIGEPDEDISEIVARVEKGLGSDEALLPKEENGKVGKVSESAEKTLSSKVKMLPKLRKMVRDKGIDVDELVAFVGDSRITEKDVLRFESSRVVPSVGLSVVPGVSKKGRREPMSSMRRAISANMSKSCENTARLTNITEVDMTECLRKLAEHKKKGHTISVTAAIIKTCAIALSEHEIVNASIEGNDIVYHGEVNIGCAVDVSNGLVVPVVRNADKKDVLAISEEVSEFAKHAQQGTLSGSDMSGGTFTVSNVGMLGVEVFTPIINYPQVAIMGVGTITKLPRYLDVTSEILVPRNIMKLSLTYDHRIVDGAPAARFSLRVRELLENPILIMGSEIC